MQEDLEGYQLSPSSSTSPGPSGLCPPYGNHRRTPTRQACLHSAHKWIPIRVLWKIQSSRVFLRNTSPKVVRPVGDHKGSHVMVPLGQVCSSSLPACTERPFPGYSLVRQPMFPEWCSYLAAFRLHLILLECRHQRRLHLAPRCRAFLQSRRQIWYPP